MYMLVFLLNSTPHEGKGKEEAELRMEGLMALVN